jgi:predicted dehydrogenase
MLAEMKADVAVIITPHTFHAPLAIDALQAGCHVLIEKPIALHIAEVDAIAKAAAQANRLVAVNFQQRFRPEVRAARQLIHAGKLGIIQNFDMKAIWPRSQAYYASGGWRATWKGEGGGVLMNQAPHNLDLIIHLLGLPKRVMAWTRTLVHPIEVEDTVQAMLEWDNGALGSMHTSTAESGLKDRIEIIGTKGTLQIEQGKLTFHAFEQDLLEYFETTSERYRGPAMTEVPVTLDTTTTGHHRDVYQDLHDAIQQGKALMCDATEGGQSLELANAMIFSSHTQNAVELPLDRQAYAQLLSDLQAGRTTLRG